MRTVWVSIRRLKIHEFNTTLRHIKSTGPSWHDVYIRLGELQAEATLRTIKQSSALFFLYIAISSLGNGHTVSITIGGITASFPTSLTATLAGLALLLVVQGTQTIAMIQSIRTNESIRIKLRGFSANSYGLYHGQDEMALSIPVPINNFLKEKLPVSRIIERLIILAYASILIPLFSAWLFLLKTQYSILISIAPHLSDQIISTFGIFVLVIIPSYAILFNIPIPMKKNAFSIRWGFLVTLYPLRAHPMLGSGPIDRLVNSAPL